MSRLPMPPGPVLRRLRKGVVIPAHPLALTRERKLDERRQRALSRYYMAAGAGGLAIGVHTTQFEIHNPKVGLLRPVLELGRDTMDADAPRTGGPLIRVAGIVGNTKQAVREAGQAVDLGYHAGLVNLGAMAKASNRRLVDHMRQISRVIPIFGFYLSTALGGRPLDLSVWRSFLEIENLIAIKIATFDRYQTFDLMRAVVEAGRHKDVALYTGNDDNIIMDLLTACRFGEGRKNPPVRIVGGLLGDWAFWTKRAVSQLEECHRIVAQQKLPVPSEMITLSVQVTDANAAAFDPAHGFAGTLPGVHEFLRRQGLLAGRWCLNRKLALSAGQAAEIDRVYKAYPHLNDDAFVAAHLETWLN